MVAPAAAQANSGFEAAPLLVGAELAPAALLKGPLHAVAEPVQVDGYFGRFVIESKYGKFVVLGVNMLGVRDSELPAIEALQQVQGSQAFQDSLVKAASAPIQLVQSAVNNPMGTVENVGQGVGTVLGRIGFFAKSTAQSVADSASDRNSAQTPSGLPPAPAGEPAPPSFTGDPFGYNKARREWAKQLKIDPYTTNPVLRPLLDKAAAASFAGSFAVNTALGAVSMPVNMVVEFDGTVRDAVWNQPAIDLAQQNESKLLAMGVDGRIVRNFLRNTWFTPTLQTALVTALGTMNSIGGVQSVIDIASQMQGETRARFLVDSIRMLGRYSKSDARLVKLTMSNMVPVGIERDGTPVAAVAIDYAYWDETAAQFAQRKELHGKRRVLLVAGAVSARAKQQFERAGVTLRSGLRQ
jgi:hypothetical protein